MEIRVVENAEAVSQQEIEQRLSRAGFDLPPAERDDVVKAYGDLLRLFACLRRVDRGPHVEMLIGYVPGTDR